tara:strand:- start:10771 stop:12039 length:1269 start_codon:yes stop_codon:yes gene_type:complete
VSEWTVATLDDCLETLIDYRGKSPTKSATGIPVLSAKVVKSTGLLSPIEQTISKEYYHKWMTRGFPKPGDVILTTEGPLGEVIQLNKKTAKYALGQRIVCLRGKNKKLDNGFLRYLLISPSQQATMASFATGTTVLGISQKSLRRMPIQYPNFDEQKAIANVLSALDDKIENIRRMNATLEAMAQAIFKDWFVDFGPTRRKIAATEQGGETNPVAIMGGLIPDPKKATQTAALFPNGFGHDCMPETWEVETLKDVLELSYGKSLPKTKRTPGPVPVYGSGGVTGTHNKAMVEGPGIIIGRKGTVGSLYWEERDFFPIDTVFFVTPKNQIGLNYLWHLLSTLGLQNMNTDAAVPGLNRDNAYQLKISDPGRPLKDAFEGIAATLQTKLQANWAENSALAETRDYLLPRLMSGQIRATDIGGMR